MVLLVLGIIQQGDKTEKISSFEVVFNTPMGLCRSLEEAKKACEAKDLDADLCIKPVVFVVGDTLGELVQ